MVMVMGFITFMVGVINNYLIGNFACYGGGMNNLSQHAITIIISVGLSYAVITPRVGHEATRTVEYIKGCEQMLIRGALEPMCAGYLEYIGYDVKTQAVVYSQSPYNPTGNDTLPQIREIGVKPDDK